MLSTLTPTVEKYYLTHQHNYLTLDGVLTGASRAGLEGLVGAACKIQISETIYL